MLRVAGLLRDFAGTRNFFDGLLYFRSATEIAGSLRSFDVAEDDKCGWQYFRITSGCFCSTFRKLPVGCC